MLISAAIEEYLACKENVVTHDTYNWYLWMLNPFQKWCEENGLTELSQVTAAHVQKFISSKPDLSSNTKHHRARVAKTFLNWCSKDEDMGVRTKTVDRIEMPKAVQPDVEILSHSDIRKLLASAEKTQHPLRDRAIILLLLDTGVRIAELVYDAERPEEETGLMLRNTVLGRRGAESYILVMGKGRKPRTVRMGQETRLAIMKYINHERPRTEQPYLFVANGNVPLTVRRTQDILTELGEASKVPNVHPHRFRHTFAINQLLAGVAELILMQLMGHTSLASTKIYTRALSQLQAMKASISVVDRMKKI